MTEPRRGPNHTGFHTTAAARALTHTATTLYWQELIPNRPIRPLPAEILFDELTPKEQKIAVSTGHEAVNLDTPAANSAISSLYNKFMTNLTRSQLAAHYTPHRLSAKLTSLIDHAGIDWQSVTVLDAACGTGSLMLPVIRLMRKHPPTALTDPARILQDIALRLRGFDIDPFAVWLAQVFLDVEMSRIPGADANDLPTLLYVRNTLESDPQLGQYDLVLANPPYRKVTPHPDVHEKFKRSLSGQPNTCTLFIDQALRLTRPGGTTALITPTSILTGQTFQALRKTLAQEAFPIALDFITTRQDIFENVLQEIVLTVHRKRPIQPTARVLSSSPLPDGFATAPIGAFTLPVRPEQPWLIPRLPGHQTIAQQAMKMPHRLPDYGYQIHTGPLVWNRHRTHLRQYYGKECKPVIWSQCILPHGGFRFPPDHPNRPPYIWIQHPADRQLVTTVPCILIKRTTAPEQDRRLAAAALPTDFLYAYSGVVVENHVNIIVPVVPKPMVSITALTHLLNSQTADTVMRCIASSTAVSAYELKSLPLPPPEQAAKLDKIAKANPSQHHLEQAIQTLYLD